MIREFRVVKVPLSLGRSVFLVVSEDINDPDVWVVINRFATALEGWRYVTEVQARNRALVGDLTGVSRNAGGLLPRHPEIRESIVA